MQISLDDRRRIAATVAAGMAGLFAAARFILVFLGQSSERSSVLLVTGGMAAGAIMCWVLAPLTGSLWRERIWVGTGVAGVTAAILGVCWLVFGIPSGFVAAAAAVVTAVGFSVSGVTLAVARGVGPISGGLIVAAGAMLIIPAPYGFPIQAIGWIATAAGAALAIGTSEADRRPPTRDDQGKPDDGPPIPRAAKGELHIGFAADRWWRSRYDRKP